MALSGLRWRSRAPTPIRMRVRLWSCWNSALFPTRRPRPRLSRRKTCRRRSCVRTDVSPAAAPNFDADASGGDSGSAAARSVATPEVALAPPPPPPPPAPGPNPPEAPPTSAFVPIARRSLRARPPARRPSPRPPRRRPRPLRAPRSAAKRPSRQRRCKAGSASDRADRASQAVSRRRKRPLRRCQGRLQHRSPAALYASAHRRFVRRGRAGSGGARSPAAFAAVSNAALRPARRRLELHRARSLSAGEFALAR